MNFEYFQNEYFQSDECLNIFKLRFKNMNLNLKTVKNIKLNCIHFHNKGILYISKQNPVCCNLCNRIYKL